MLVPVLPFGVASQPGGPTRLQSLSRPRRASLRLSIRGGLAVARVPRRAQEVRLLGAGVTAPLPGISRACGPEAEMGGRMASAVPERPDLMRCVFTPSAPAPCVLYTHLNIYVGDLGASTLAGSSPLLLSKVGADLGDL